MNGRKVKAFLVPRTRRQENNRFKSRGRRRKQQRRRFTKKTEMVTNQFIK
jgi:hypothetical protein